MGHCSLCGEEMQYPFECSHCGRAFCAKHRLPESHLCPRITHTYNESFTESQNATEQPQDWIYKSEPPPPHPPYSGQTSTISRPKNFLKKWQFATIAILLVAALTASCFAAYQAYEAVNYYSANSQGLQNNGTVFTLIDPTYSQMKAFLSFDKTNENAYTTEYTCVDFSKDVCNNAFADGYRCGFVYVKLDGPYDHAMICFNTTDHGLIFIEPQDDSEVDLYVGGYLNGYYEILALDIIW